MVRVLNVERLLRALEPELARRLQNGRSHPEVNLRIEKEIGGGKLFGGSTVQFAETAEQVSVRLSQHALARLVLGAYEPADILSRARLALDIRLEKC